MYKKFNANPEGKEINDCLIRAMATALPLTYQQAKALLEETGAKIGKPYNSSITLDIVIKNLGLEIRPASRKTFGKAALDTEYGYFERDTKYIFLACNHAAAVINGVLYDTWDSSRKIVQYTIKVTAEAWERIAKKFASKKNERGEQKMKNWEEVFAKVATMEELKKAYKAACLACHPDKGGSAEEFKKMTAAHDRRAAEIAKGEATQELNRNKKADGSFKSFDEILQEQAEFTEILTILMTLNGLEIELCGSWLWIGGETKAVKDTLKAAGCKWAARKKLWYWHAGEWLKKVHKSLTMDEIRDLHGSEILKYRPSSALLN